MDAAIPILAAIVFAAVVASLVSVLRSAAARGVGAGGQKARRFVIRECSKKLAHDPRNVQALTTLGDLYYDEQNWDKAFPLYNLLFDLIPTHVEIDAGKTAARQGISAFHIERFEDAERGLLAACKFEPDNFDANFYLGRLMYQKNEYEKAVLCLRKARSINPESTETDEPLGLSYFKSQHYRESIPFLRRVLDEDPTDKDALFAIATAMDKTGYGDKALKVFMHLRPDPQYGAQSCLSAGLIHEHANQYQLAEQDYEIGLKLENVPLDLVTMLRYRLANAHLAQKNIGKALTYLKEIQDTVPGYKDVPALIQRYQELNTNANLQTYIMSPTADFVALCRRFVTSYYSDATVKIEDAAVTQEFVEILCTVDTPRWEDSELFRFYRSTGAIGELYVREFHSKLRDIKCDKGFCITAGAFTEGAHKFSEGRPIDLIEKDRLVSMLKKLM
ncbi:tetratricopeptide repeat protein [Treponema socranskii]|uniref:tetratricopeptide repeat protein n=1 Tax=Treponema socranskii TaxID=53419 RepID=UPI0023F529BA|nr:tetratricopeptide repeat protein [Treponema socranskii]